MSGVRFDSCSFFVGRMEICSVFRIVISILRFVVILFEGYEESWVVFYGIGSSFFIFVKLIWYYLV